MWCGIAMAAALPALATPPERAPVIGLAEQPDITLARKLTAAGYRWGGYEKRGQDWPDWTLDQMKRFNVLVLVYYPQTGTEGPTPAQQRYIAHLRQFVAEGGGLFLCGGNNQDTGMCVRFQNALLEPYGATVLREFVSDKKHVLKGSFFNFGWTSDIAPGPLTQGVQSLLYPMLVGWGGTSATNPIRVDRTWQVLVRAMPEAYTCALYDSAPMKDEPAGYKASPPLVAVRPAGKGRIVLWPTLATCTFIDGYHFLWDNGLVLEGSSGDRSSQGLVLVRHLLQWLAEPSRLDPAYGTYVPPATTQRDLTQEEGFAAIDWDKARVPDGLPHAYKCLIGARTAYSGGRGTVAEYAAAARQHGYAFLAITEALEQMTETKWSQLTADCRAASRPDLVVLPGLRFRDENGNQFVCYGDIGWPKPEWFSDRQPGRVKVCWHFTHGFAYWPPLAVITPKSNPKRPWFLGKTKGYAAFTYENGRLLDESVAEYLELMRLRFDNWVVAVHLLDSPAAVAAAAAPENMQTYVRAQRLEDVHGHMSGTYGKFRLWYFPVYVSNGPEIQTFQALNPGTTDLAVPGNERYRLRLQARSTGPLREVRLYDGPHLMRRFALSAASDDRSLDFFHDRQRCWVPEVIDAQGRRAIGWARWTEVQEHWFTNCGDNWNFMTGGKWRGSRYHTCRGLETSIGSASVDYAYPHLRLAEVDGKPWVPDPRRGYPAVHVDKVMVSRFASIVDTVTEGHYEKGGSANWNDFAQREGILPLDSHALHVRTTFFTSRPDAIQARLVEGEIRFKKPVRLAPGHAAVTATCYSGKRGPDAYNLLALSLPDGRFLVERRPAVVPKEVSRWAELADGGYVAIYPYLGGLVGVFALEPGFTAQAWFTQDTTNFMLHFGRGDCSFQPGQGLRYRQIVCQGRTFDVASNHEMEAIRHGLGLAGPGAYEVKPSVGRVLGRRFFLHAAAEEGGFRARFTKAQLPADLPLVVEGLNPRWGAGLWYVGTNVMHRPEWTKNEYQQLVAVLQKRTLRDAWYPGPVHDGRGYFGLDIEASDREVFAGNYLVCDRPELYLLLVDLRPGRRQVEVHNPGDQPVTATVRPAKGFDLLGTFALPVTVPAGASVYVPVP